MTLESSIGETCIIKGGKRLPKGHQYAQSKKEHPYIRTTDIVGHKINVLGVEYIAPKTY